MKILLVEPRTPETFWSLRHALRFVGKRAANPPLGLLNLAGLLPRNWSYRLLDQNTCELTDADVAWANYVLVSAMVIHRKKVAKLGERCRRLDTPLIGSGPLFRAEADGTLGVDHVVVGEAEELADRLVAEMRGGDLQSRYVAERYPDLSLTSQPRWDLARGALRDNVGAVVPGLPVRLRILRRGGAERPQTPLQVAGAVRGRRGITTGWGCQDCEL